MARTRPTLTLDPLLTPKFFELPPPKKSKDLEVKLDFPIPLAKEFPDFIAANEAKSEKEPLTQFKKGLKQLVEALKAEVSKTFGEDQESIRKIATTLDTFYTQNFDLPLTVLDENYSDLYTKGALKLAEFIKAHQAEDLTPELRRLSFIYLSSGLEAGPGSVSEHLERAYDHLKLKLDFLLPTVETFREFVKAAEPHLPSEEPRDNDSLLKFRARVEDLVNGLKARVDELWVDDADRAKDLKDKLDSFYQDKFGLDRAQMNDRYVDLYVEGPVYMGKLIKAYGSEDYSLEKRQSNFSNLINSIGLCPPGANLNLKKSLVDLDMDVSTKLMVIRKKIAEDAAQEAATFYGMHDGSEIHYATALLNRYAKVLGIDKDRDYYEAKSPEQLETLAERFIPTLNETLNLQSILNKIKFDLEIERVVQEARKKYSGQYKGKAGVEAIVEEFEKLLAPFGEVKDASGEAITLQPSLFKCMDEESMSFILLSDEEIDAAINLNLMLRLGASGYADLSKQKLVKEKEAYLAEVDEDDEELKDWEVIETLPFYLHYLPAEPYRLSLSYMDRDQAREPKPLKTLILEKLAEQNYEALNWLPEGQERDAFIHELLRAEKRKYHGQETPPREEKEREVKEEKEDKEEKEVKEEKEAPVPRANLLPGQQGLLNHLAREGFFSEESVSDFSNFIKALNEEEQLELVKAVFANIKTKITKAKTLAILLESKPERVQAYILGELQTRLDELITKFGDAREIFMTLTGTQPFDLFFQAANTNIKAIIKNKLSIVFEDAATYNKAAAIPHLADLMDGDCSKMRYAGHLAAVNGQVDVLRALMEVGYVFTTLDVHQGLDVLRHARNSKQKKVVELFASWEEEQIKQIGILLVGHYQQAAVDESFAALKSQASWLMTESHFLCVYIEVYSRLKGFEELKQAMQAFPDSFKDKDLKEARNFAITAGKLDFLRLLEKLDPKRYTPDPKKDKDLLYLATLEGQAGLIGYFKEKGFNLNGMGNRGALVVFAGEHEDIDFVKALKEAGAENVYLIKDGCKHSKKIQALYEQWKADFHEKLEIAVDAFLEAKEDRDEKLKAIEKLVDEAKSYLDFRDHLPNDYLLKHYKNGAIPPDHVLLKVYQKRVAEVKADYEGKKGKSLILDAILGNNHPLIPFLVSLGADLAKRPDGTSLADHAVTQGKIDCLKALKACGADMLDVWQHLFLTEGEGLEELRALYAAWEEEVDTSLAKAINTLKLSTEREEKGEEQGLDVALEGLRLAIHEGNKIILLNDLSLRLFAELDKNYPELKQSTFKKILELLGSKDIDDENLGPLVLRILQGEKAGLIEFLSKMGFDINAEVLGRSLAQIAVLGNSYDALSALKKAGANLNKSKVNQESPYQLAQRPENHLALRFFEEQLFLIQSKLLAFLKRIQPADELNPDLYPALQALIKETRQVFGLSKFFELLVELAPLAVASSVIKAYISLPGIEPNALDPDEGLGLIHIIASIGLADLLPYLVSKGLNLNLKGRTGTAAHIAVAKGDQGLAMLKALKEQGAELALTDDHSKLTPRALASEKSSPPVCQLFEQWLKDVKRQWEVFSVNLQAEEKVASAETIQSLCAATFQIANGNAFQYFYKECYKELAPKDVLKHSKTLLSIAGILVNRGDYYDQWLHILSPEMQVEFLKEYPPRFEWLGSSYDQLNNCFNSLASDEARRLFLTSPGLLLKLEKPEAEEEAKRQNCLNTLLRDCATKGHAEAIPVLKEQKEGKEGLGKPLEALPRLAAVTGTLWNRERKQEQEQKEEKRSPRPPSPGGGPDEAD